MDQVEIKKEFVLIVNEQEIYLPEVQAKKLWESLKLIFEPLRS